MANLLVLSTIIGNTLAAAAAAAVTDLANAAIRHENIRARRKRGEAKPCPGWCASQGTASMFCRLETTPMLGTVRICCLTTGRSQRPAADTWEPGRRSSSYLRSHFWPAGRRIGPAAF